jgi:predicted transcriptional regulator
MLGPALHKVSTSKLNQPPKGSKMNILKNFESVFIVTLGLACAATVTIGSEPTIQHAAKATYTTVAQQDVPVVVVSAKRMTAEEKKQSLLEETKAALAEGNAAARKI